MNEATYQFQQTGSRHFFTFFSTGVKGEITKMVRISELRPGDYGFQETPIHNVAFGDLKETNGKFVLDDSAHSNNGDIRKVMATVVRILQQYLKKHYPVVLSFSGYPDSTSADADAGKRMRLYQKIIDSNWDALHAKYHLWGALDSIIEVYIPAKPYRRVLVQKRAL